MEQSTALFYVRLADWGRRVWNSLTVISEKASNRILPAIGSKDNLMRLHSLATTLGVALLAGIASSAHAVDLPGTGLSLSGSATVASDYRFRGISQSDKDPALQLGLTLGHSSGFYAGVWGSSIDLYDDDAAAGFNGGKDIEIDYFAGWGGDIAPGVTVDANVTYYSYPGVTGTTNYAEATASMAFALGPLDAKVGGSYFPDQKAVPDDGSYLFGELSAEIPAAFTLTGHIGRQFYGSNFGPDADYWEWSLGASRSFGPITAGISYIDTNLARGLKGGATVVASLGASF